MCNNDTYSVSHFDAVALKLGRCTSVISRRWSEHFFHFSSFVFIWLWVFFLLFLPFFFGNCMLLKCTCVWSNARSSSVSRHLVRIVSMFLEYSFHPSVRVQGFRLTNKVYAFLGSGIKQVSAGISKRCAIQWWWSVDITCLVSPTLCFWAGVKEHYTTGPVGARPSWGHHYSPLCSLDSLGKCHHHYGLNSRHPHPSTTSNYRSHVSGEWPLLSVSLTVLGQAHGSDMFCGPYLWQCQYRAILAQLALTFLGIGHAVPYTAWQLKPFPHSFCLSSGWATEAGYWTTVILMCSVEHYLEHLPPVTQPVAWLCSKPTSPTISLLHLLVSSRVQSSYSNSSGDVCYQLLPWRWRQALCTSFRPPECWAIFWARSMPSPLHRQLGSSRPSRSQVSLHCFLALAVLSLAESWLANTQDPDPTSFDFPLSIAIHCLVSLSLWSHPMWSSWPNRNPSGKHKEKKEHKLKCQ